ncbi:NADH:flavin oxidoreductase [Edwardsiella hoshinae]|uniref:NADH:flavin oxidoreductase n=1 Tax=Edwardsiella hoshinae TaxID=93378 RepID=A0ABM6EL13_9GAMM|nr:FAD-dependent oxidoreductase [Edwardsiella hoshinae]AOV97591.1 NADH:flavin oxidoreductase [Edwardsiella hoshinae]
MVKYTHLFSPLALTPTLSLKNRIMKSPQSTMYWGAEYAMSDRVVDFYESIAQGGAGMIVIAGILWYPAHPGGIYGALFDDRYIAGMRRLVTALHRHDCVVFCQFHHTGPSAPSDEHGGRPFAAATLEQAELPSPAPYLHATRGVTRDEIAMHRERYIAAAVRAYQAGFDGVEVHGAHGYFLQSFLSRVWNRRDDEYGSQSIENRTRLMVEIIRGIKARLGEAFPVGVRINGEEFMAQGAMTLEESIQIAQTLERAGACYISVSGYGFGPLPMTYVPDYFPYPEPEAAMRPYMTRYAQDGLYAFAAAAIKPHVAIPVVAVGCMDEQRGERLLRAGKADIIAYGRMLWADPAFPNKLRAGRERDIVRCNRCATCEDPPRAARRCRVNPALGRERELAIQPAVLPRHILVIGAGPAGMEAARVAALRGHQVTLCDAASRLGGRLWLASMIKGREVEDVHPLLEYLTYQVANGTGIDIRLNRPMGIEDVLAVQPDVVVVATGGNYALPAIPGIQRWNVKGIKSLSRLAAWPLRVFGPDLLNRLTRIALPLGRRIVILGGQIEGIQGAIFLAKRGKRVTVLEPSAQLGEGIPPRYRERALAWLRQHPRVSLCTGVRWQRIDRQGVHIVTEAGIARCEPCHSVLVLTRQSPATELADALRNRGMEVHTIGSVNGARHSLIVDALAQGREVGVRL